MKVKTIDSLGDVTGKRVLLRLDLNVPVSGGAVVDAFRIDSALPTIALLRERGAKVGIVAHIENEEGASLLPVFEYLKTKTPLLFVPHLPELAAALAHGVPGSVVLMENIRQYEGEKKNDTAFSQELAAIADMYVNDAFSVSHRAHASVAGVTAFLPSVAGPLLLKEIEELSRAFAPQHPLFLVLGGAKFETKLPLVEKFLSIADTIFIGGALGNDLLKARGLPVGKSKLSKTEIDMSAIASSKNVIAPLDVLVESEGGGVVKLVADVGAEDKIVDSGPQTAELLAKKIAEAKMVIWNGPFGYFEGGYGRGTEEFARTLAAQKSSVYSILGGGDTLSAIERLHCNDSFSFVSTGGGAMLDFLSSGGQLPGILPLVQKE